MENKATKISENRAEAELLTTWEDIKKVYDATLAKYQKQITLPGFRKGKAPMNVLEAKIGEEVLRDSCFEAMNNSISSLFENVDESLRALPYSTPEIVDNDKLLPFKKEQDISFKIRYDITPEIKLEKYKGLDVEIPNVVVSDEMVAGEIERYRNQNSIVKTKGDGAEIANGDLVTLDYEVIGKEGEEGTGRKISDFTFTVGEKKNIYQFDDDVIGLKEGDEKEFVKKSGDDDIKIKVAIKTIKVKELPDVNDEFAQDIKSEYKTVADLKAGIKKQISDDLDERMKDTKLTAVCDKILESTNIAIPESMIAYETELGFRRAAGQYNMSSKDFEKFLTKIGQSKASFTSPWRADVEKSIKIRLIIDAVEKAESIKADDEKVKAMLEKQISEDTDEEMKKRIENSIRDQMDFSATIDYLIENNNLKKGKKEITYEDYISGKYLEDEKTESESEGKSESKKSPAKSKKESSKAKAEDSKTEDSKAEAESDKA